MEPTTKTYYIVEIGGADIYFEKLEDASAFFASVARAPLKNIDRSYDKGKTWHYVGDGGLKISMKQETLVVYPTRKAKEFAVSSGDEKV